MADLIHDLAGMGFEGPRTSARAAADWAAEWEALQADAEASDRCAQATREARKRPSGGRPVAKRAAEPIWGLQVLRMANGYTVVGELCPPRAARDALRWRPKSRPVGGAQTGEALFYTSDHGDVEERSVARLSYSYQPDVVGERDWLDRALRGEAFSMGGQHDRALFAIHAKREVERRWARIAYRMRRLGFSGASIRRARDRYRARIELLPREQLLRQGGQEDAPRA